MILYNEALDELLLLLHHGELRMALGYMAEVESGKFKMFAQHTLVGEWVFVGLL